MIVRSLNLYEHFGIPAPEGAVGRLTCFVPMVTREISQNRTRPAVLVLPGGGYWFTSEREGEPVALRFAARGYAAFVLEYSCTPHMFPVALREACMAMRYIREQAAEFCVDSHMVAAIGFSAGGHLCGTLGTMYDCPEVADLGDAGALRPDALGLCYPVTVSWGPTHEGTFENISGGDPALRQRLSLDKLVRSDMPPVFLWHTRDDDAVPCRNSLLLALALDEAGVDLSLHLYRHGQHGLSLTDETVFPAHNIPAISADVPGWLDAMLDFFRETGFHATDHPATP